MTLFRKIIITTLAVAILFAAGCGRRSRGRNGREVLARVGDAVLMNYDVKEIYPTEATGADSLILLEAYVNGWVKKQVKLREAERLATGSGVDIEAMVEDYRNSLITHRLDQYYVEKYVDSLIPASQIAKYYEQHPQQFILDRTIVRGRIVRVSDSYRQMSKLKELMGSSQAERQKDFKVICEKNSFPLSEFATWVDFSDFLSYLPVTRGRDYDYLLANRGVQELADSDNKYFVQITSFRKRGEQAPLEMAEHKVSQIIYNQRSSEIIRRFEDSLYNAALGSGDVTINLESSNNP